MELYRKQIIVTLNQLIMARDVIFEQIINLAMKREYEDINNIFENGDVYKFSLEQFENMEDVNVQKLVKLCRKTEKTIFSLMNMNGIEEDEVQLEEDDVV
jgi:hypothetical protein